MMENFGDMLDALQVDQGFFEIFPNGETAMLAKQERIVVADERTDDFRVLAGRWGGVRADGNVSQRERDFGQYVIGKVQPCDSERGGENGMRVDDGVDIGSQF